MNTFIKTKSLVLALAMLGAAGALKAQTVEINVVGNITGKTCTLETQDLVVDMGTVEISEFSNVSVGGTIARRSTGNIVVDCPQAGASISLSMQDANNENSTLPYLGLNPGSAVAQGVGIQMFQPNGTPVPLGPDSSWVAGTNVPAGRYTVPITAGYYRTGNVTAGTANARSVFEVTYN